MIEIQATDNEVVESTSVELIVDAPTEVNTSESKAVELYPNSYVLTSLGIYRGNLDGSIPTWLLNAVQQVLTTGDGNLTQVLADLQLVIDNLEVGVNQNVTNINNTQLSLAALETSVVSRLDENDATILELDTTKVTATEAQAIAVTAVQSSFGNDIDAYIGNIASTYVDATSAIANDVSLLTTSLNGTNASVSRIDQAVVDTIRENPLWVDDGVQTDPDIYGQPRYITEARAKSSLEVNADGQVSGFVAEVDGGVSNFTITADVFSVVAASQTAPIQNPFTVNATTGIISLNGQVEFTNVLNVPKVVNRLPSTVHPVDPSEGDVWYKTDLNNEAVWYDGLDWLPISQDVAQAVNDGTTTIDGASITTGTIDTAQLAAAAVTADKILANTITANHIDSNTITANEIEANTITSNLMDTNVLLVNGKIESSNYAWNSGNPTGFAMYATGDTVSGSAYNIIGGKIYGALLNGIELNINDINLRDRNNNIIAAHFAGRGRVALDNTLTPKVMSIYFDFYAGDDNRTSAFKTVPTGSYLSIGSEANSSVFGVVQRDGWEFLFTSDDASIDVTFYAGADPIGAASAINTAPDSHLGVGFARYADNIGGDTYSYYISTKSVMTAYELNGNGYFWIKLVSGTTMGTYLTHGFKIDYSVSNM